VIFLDKFVIKIYKNATFMLSLYDNSFSLIRPHDDIFVDPLAFLLLSFKNTRSLGATPSVLKYKIF
jgi:hypothetical protein